MSLLPYGVELYDDQHEFLWALLEGPAMMPLELYEFGYDALYKFGYIEGADIPGSIPSGYAITTLGLFALELWANSIAFQAQFSGGSWCVVDGYDALLYESVLTEHEAMELAWAFNNGAVDDDDAMRMIAQDKAGATLP